MNNILEEDSPTKGSKLNLLLSISIYLIVFSILRFILLRSKIGPGLGIDYYISVITYFWNGLYTLFIWSFFMFIPLLITLALFRKSTWIGAIMRILLPAPLMLFVGFLLVWVLYAFGLDEKFGYIAGGFYMGAGFGPALVLIVVIIVVTILSPLLFGIYKNFNKKKVVIAAVIIFSFSIISLFLSSVEFEKERVQSGCATLFGWIISENPNTEISRLQRGSRTDELNKNNINKMTLKWGSMCRENLELYIENAWIFKRYGYDHRYNDTSVIEIEKNKIRKWARG